MRLEHVGGQVKEELDEFIEFVNHYEPESYLEIGAREGEALRYFVERVPTISHVTAVDLPGAAWGRAKSENQLRQNLMAAPCSPRLILGDSTDPAVIKQVHERTYSIVFVDGDHSYEGVSRDLSNYLLVADTMFVMHDINHPPESRAYGPSRLWNEIKEMPGYEESMIEFIAPGSHKGIGVLLT